MSIDGLELTKQEFEAVCKITYDECGINLKEGKESLVQSRLAKRLRKLGLGSVTAYLKYIETDASKRELNAMIDSLTTNKTFFFRESRHFDFLREEIVPGLSRGNGPIRIWSAGCSSGEEPYSVAIALSEQIRDAAARVKILSTDLSPTVLDKGRKGRYHQTEVGDVPANLLSKYFVELQEKSERYFVVKPQIRSMLAFAQLNLLDRWPMQGPFDLILCRNVMIYFDQETRLKIVPRFRDLLRPGGHLFIGHSESIPRSLAGIEYVSPAIYARAEPMSRAA